MFGCSLPHSSMLTGSISTGPLIVNRPAGLLRCVATSTTLAAADIPFRYQTSGQTFLPSPSSFSSSPNPSEIFHLNDCERIVYLAWKEGIKSRWKPLRSLPSSSSVCPSHRTVSAWSLEPWGLTNQKIGRTDTRNARRRGPRRVEKVAISMVLCDEGVRGPAEVPHLERSEPTESCARVPQRKDATK